MSAQEICVPDIGDVDEVEVIEVLVNAGDTVAVDDALITLESDKASMDVPAPAAGVVKEMKVQVGDKVSEGTLILLLEGTAAATSEVGSKATPAPALASPPAATPTAAPGTPSAVGSGQGIYASPGVRREARLQGVDLTQVPATGPKGRVTKEDVANFSKTDAAPAQAKSGAKAAATGMGIPPIPAADYAKFGPIREEPLSRIKKISGPHLHRAWLNVPMVTHHDEADVTEMEAFRQGMKAEAEKAGLRITPLAFIMQAVASALKTFPSFNASLSEDGTALILKEYYHLGIAMDTPNGLVVPVIRDVDQKSIYELSQELGDTSGRARAGKLGAKDLQGGCMSISSLGGIGGTAFTPIVNAPEVAILGVTRSYMKPVWDGKAFEPRLMMPLDLSYDHRVIDGAQAAHFVAYLCKALADLRRLLL